MGKREERRKKQLREQRRKRAFLFILTFGLTAVIIIFVVLPIIRSTVQPTSGNIQLPPEVSRPMVNNDSMGDPDAPVKITNISNYNCGHCANFALDSIANALSEEEIIDTYIETGKVNFTYLPYSWTPEEPFSPEEATYCAMDQGKFWEYRDIVFSNTDLLSQDGNNKQQLLAFADALDLDISAFETCFESHQYLEKVKENVTYARGLGLEGTPSFLVNDQLVFASALIDTIEAKLAQ